MPINPEKFLTSASSSLLSRVSQVGQTLSSVNTGIDQALAQAGSLFKTSRTRDTGGDAFVSDVSAFESSNEDNPRTPDTVAASVGSEISNQEIQNLVYPANLPHDFRLNLQFMDYKRPAPSVQAKEERTMFVSLPLPRELYDNKSISYSEQELGLVGSIADAMQIAGLGGEGSVTGQAAGAGVRASQAGLAARALTGPGIRRLAGITAAGLLNESTRTAASQLTGAQLNPNLSVAFEGPRLRNFTFTWEFAPHSAQESQTLKTIIQQMQARALPSMTFENSTGILSYPQMVQLELEPRTFPFKKAMIKGINVNYAPSGAPSYFHGTKEPTLIYLTVEFIEIEYFLSEDFGGDTAKGLNSDLAEISESLFEQFTDALGFAGDEEETTNNE